MQQSMALLSSNQCCGAETFCFHSGSEFQKVSAPAPAPALAPEPAPSLALYLPFITDFILKSGFFMFFIKEYQPNSHAGFYTIWILIFIYYSSWPGAETSTFRLQPKVPAPQSLPVRLPPRLMNGLPIAERLSLKQNVPAASRQQHRPSFYICW